MKPLASFLLGLLLGTVVLKCSDLFRSPGVSVKAPIRRSKTYSDDTDGLEFADNPVMSAAGLGIVEKVDALELVELFHHLFEGKEAQRPLFVILFGPPGSGKTNIVRKILRTCFGKLKNFAEIIVDNMLKRITPYRKQSDELLSRRGNMTEEAYVAHAQALYARFRPVVKYFSAMLLDVALRQRLNVLFETTGSNTSLTISMVQYARRIGYHVHVVYPYVTLEELTLRVNKRNSKIGRALPLSAIQKMEQESLQNFPAFLQYVDSAAVYDNNGAFETPLNPIFSKSEPDGELDDAPPPQQSGDAGHVYQCSDDLRHFPALHQLLQPFCDGPVQRPPSQQRLDATHRGHIEL